MRSKVEDTSATAVRSMRVRRMHFDFAADSVYERAPLSFRPIQVDERLRAQAWAYVCAWQACTDGIYALESC